MFKLYHFSRSLAAKSSMGRTVIAMSHTPASFSCFEAVSRVVNWLIQSLRAFRRAIAHEKRFSGKIIPFMLN